MNYVVETRIRGVKVSGGGLLWGALGKFNLEVVGALSFPQIVLVAGLGGGGGEAVIVRSCPPR